MSNRKTRVVVMGGSSGIGEASAKLFGERGHAVVIAGRDADKLEAARARLGGIAAHVVDGTSAEATARFFEEVGAFDHLVLAFSGGKGAGLFRGLAPSDLRLGFDAKFWGYVTALRSALPVLCEGGSVTFISAGSARAALAGTAGLAAINGAIEAMVRPLATELAPTRVNAVSPGIIRTPWWDAMPAAARDGFFAQAETQLPVRRIGAPEDVAQAVVMVAENPFITGTVIEVDGGGHLAR